MAISTGQASGRAFPEPEVLRRNVVEQLNRLPDESVVVLYDLAQELELRAAWAEFSEGMARDWAAGQYERLDEALAEARSAIREARAG